MPFTGKKARVYCHERERGCWEPGGLWPMQVRPLVVGLGGESDPASAWQRGARGGGVAELAVSAVVATEEQREEPCDADRGINA